MLWASKAQDAINNTMNPILLDFYNKKNMRSLSTLEISETENIKTKILLNINPVEAITEATIAKAFANINDSEINILHKEYLSWLKNLSSNLGSVLSVEDQKQAKASFYSMVYNKI